MTAKEDASKWEPPVDRKYDWVGPADSVSKIRTVKFCRPFQESKLERNFRLQRENVQKWNHDFWKKHNEAFEKEKLEFIERIMDEKRLPRKSDVDSEMMSVFYSKFLNDRRKDNWEYNLSWYKKNFSLLYPAIRVSLYRFTRLLFRKS